MSSVTEFGRSLLRTGDLDPVYVALYKAQLDRSTLARLCLAYWCFYSLGLAARLAEIKSPKAYWAAMMRAAVNEGQNPDGSKPYPRGAERRHYRGAQAVASMASLISLYPKGAEQAVDGMLGIGKGTARPYGLDMTYGSVSAAVQRHRGFGPWIAFKIADMSERVLGYGTDFTDCHLGIYKDPRQGAAVACLEYRYPGSLKQDGVNKFAQTPWEYPITDAELQETVSHYVSIFRKERFKAPPNNNRLVNVQEIETIFCKYKSHLKGHYPLGKDTREIEHGLRGMGDLAESLRHALPPVQLELPHVNHLRH